MLGWHKHVLTASLFLFVTSGIGQEFTFNGSANDLGNDCYQLTAQVPSETGAIWNTETINMAESFQIDLLMNFGNQDLNGADGMVFVFQQVGPNALGDFGGALGYGGFEQSLGIEFDTYFNNERGDLEEDHTAIISNGNVSHLDATNLAGPVTLQENGDNVETDDFYEVSITWAACDSIITVIFDGVERLSAMVPVSTIFSDDLDVYWGLTGATGGLSNNQRACIDPFLAPPVTEVPLCNGSSTTLSLPVDNIISWEPSTFLDDPSSQNPLCTATEDITYTVTYAGVCDDLFQAQVAIDVYEVNIALNASGEISCVNATALIDASFEDFGLDFDWFQDGELLDDPLIPFLLIVTSAGEYSLTVTDQNGCQAEEAIVVSSNFETNDLTVENEDLLIDCYDPELTLTIDVEGEAPELSWSTEGGNIISSNDNEALINDAGLYTLLAIHPVSGCENSIDISVQADFTTPDVLVNEIIPLSCENPVTEVIANIDFSDAVGEFIWSDSQGELPIETLDFNVANEGAISLEATNLDNGCVTSVTFDVPANPDFYYDYSSLSIPNVFTPNGDSFNTVFKPYMASPVNFDLEDEIKRVSILVIDRWGREVFRSSDSQPYWSGLNGGNEVSEGTYYYTIFIEFVCSKRNDFERSGYITVLK